MFSMLSEEMPVKSQQLSGSEILFQNLYSWDWSDVEYAGGFIYYNDDYFYACYNGYSYYLYDGEWEFNWWTWSCDYDYPPYLGNYAQYYLYFELYQPWYIYYYTVYYYIDYDWYSWNAVDVVDNDGFVYYQNDYMYACYNGYQYYFSAGTWYWNVWQWNCVEDSAPADGNYYQYYSYLVNYYGLDAYDAHSFVYGADDDLQMYSWEDDLTYEYY
jgi:hypothetical protein